MLVIKEKKMLDERASDTAYPKIIKCFYDEFNKPNIWDASLHVGYGQEFPNVQYVFAELKDPDAVAKIIWNNLQVKLTDKELPTLKSFFPSDYYVELVTREFKLYILPQEVDPGAAAAMSTHGKMFFYPSWWPKGSPDDRLAKLSLNLLIQGRFLDKHLKGDYAHEFAHYINALRSAKDLTNKYSRVIHRARGHDKQFDVDSKEYVESTEELQARVSELFDIMQTILDKTNLDEVEPHEQYILYMLVKKDVKGLMAYFDKPILYAYRKHLADQAFINRARSRLYSGIIEFIEAPSALKNYAEDHPVLFNTRYNYQKFVTWFNGWLDKANRSIDRLINKVFPTKR